MKTILIEQVANGWIANEHDVCNLATCGYDPESVHVYLTIAELQADLPNLLSDKLPIFSGVNEKSLDLIHHAKA